ncbi:MAG TPA: 1,4-dihydroxy-2-naphthoate polyprenyltransferase [Myxococcota bacterium]
MSTAPASVPSSGPSTAAVFVEAARVRTLPAAAAPAVLGVALAVAAGGFHLVAALCAVLGALAIQIGTNYANDYFDFKNGADTDARVGPRRATQAGLVSPSTMRAAFIIAFGVAVIFGLYLVVRGGWPIVAVGVASVICGILYTGGPRPLGYLGLGDLLVLIFFGPVAVAGTVYVQTLRLDPIAVLVGLSPGLLSTAILVVNNLRDRHTDIHANKKTLAVRFGPTAARVEYTVCVVVGLLLPVVVGITQQRYATAIVLVAAPMAVGTTRAVWTTDGPALNPLLGRTAKLLLLSTVLIAVGWLLG